MPGRHKIVGKRENSLTTMELATECIHLWFPSILNPTRLFLVGHSPPTEYSWLKVRARNNGGDGFGDGFELGADGCGMPCSSSIAVSSIAGVGLGMLSVRKTRNSDRIAS